MALYIQHKSPNRNTGLIVRQLMAALLSVVTLIIVSVVIAERDGHVATVCALAFVSSNVIAIGWLLQDELFNPLSSAWLSLIIGTGLRAAYLSLSPSVGVPIMICQRERDRSSIWCYESPVIPWSGQ